MQQEETGHRCIHDEIEKYPLVFDDFPGQDEAHDEAPQDGGRTLQTTYLHKMTFRVEDLLDNPVVCPATTLISAAQKNYIRGLVNNVTDYFGRVISINELTVTKKLTATSLYCSISPGTNLSTTGFTQDMLVFITLVNDATTNYVATAQACSVLGTQKRPYVARITFNMAYLSIPTTDALLANHVSVAMHEFIHALGFSSSLFTYFPNKNRTTISVADNGYTRTYLYIGKPVNGLQDELNSYFGETNVTGLIFEQEGGTGTAGSHLEKRVFNNEIMTGMSARDMRITNFTLKFLDNTGWYTVDFKFAEPTHYGRGLKKAFYEGTCVKASTSKTVSPVNPFPDEYCTNLGKRVCSATRMQGGICGTSTVSAGSVSLGLWNYWSTNYYKMNDPLADNCPTKLYADNLDCEDPPNVPNPSFQSFGRNSRCFLGTYFPGGSYTATTSYCLKYNCVQPTPTSYFLYVNLNGTNIANCTKAGNITVTGSTGVFECPDPTSFCTKEGVVTCRRNCHGRGTCGTNGKCTCIAGFYGDDCGKKL